MPDRKREKFVRKIFRTGVVKMLNVYMQEKKEQELRGCLSFMTLTMERQKPD